jgi:hypothetical protein
MMSDGEVRDHAEEQDGREPERGQSVSSGISAARGPGTPARWRQYHEIAEIFAGPADPTWASDRALLD